MVQRRDPQQFYPEQAPGVSETDNWALRMFQDIQNFMKWTYDSIVDRLTWGGVYVQGDCYDSNTVVQDGKWTMVSIRSTCERPAPQTIGDPVASPDPDPTWVEQNFTGLVRSGNTYTLTKSGWMTKVGVWVPEVIPTVRYRVVILSQVPGGVVQTTVLDNSAPIAGQWTLLSAGATPVVVGTIISVVLEVENSSATTSVTGDWRNDGIENNVCPSARWWNRNNQQNVIRIDKIDLNAADRTSDLLSMVPGTTVVLSQLNTPAKFFSYTILSTTDNGDCVSYDVTLDSTGGGGPDELSETTMNAEVPVSQPAKYVEELDYWLTGQPSFATAKGFLELDGVLQVGREDDVFSTIVEFQEASVSDDWEMMAYNG